MVTRVLAATVAGGVAFFVLGFLLYGMVLDPMVMRPNMNPDAIKLMIDPPNMVWLVISTLVNGFLFAYIFDQWANIRTFAGGVRGGAIINFLISVMFQTMFLAFMKMSNNFTPAIADIFGSVVLGGIVGGIVGMVLGKMSGQAAAD